MIVLPFDNQQAVLSFPQELLVSDYVQSFLERLKVESVLEKSLLTEEQVFNLSESIQEDWWHKHKQSVVEKVEKYNS